MQILDAAIEHGTANLWYGRIIDLLGTHVRAANRDELLKNLESELRYHLRWLQRHGEETKIIGAIQWNIKEERGGIGELGESGGEVALFDFDLRYIDQEYLARAIRYMDYHRKDLLYLCSTIDERRMKEVPSGKERSIEGILHHVCNAEEFYISRFGKETDAIYERYLRMPVVDADRLPIMERLTVVRNACIRTLKEIIPARENTVFRRHEYCKYPEERWTAHKVLRRFLEHEREHIYNIREYLTLPLRAIL